MDFFKRRRLMRSPMRFSAIKDSALAGSISEFVAISLLSTARLLQAGVVCLSDVIHIFNVALNETVLSSMNFAATRSGKASIEAPALDQGKLRWSWTKYC
jgi:hypothetical protein